MTEPRVSVIVPVRDRRRLMRQLLEALAAQTYPSYEVVVVDDGSVDGSAEEAEADQAAGRAVVLVRRPAEGAVAARLAGVKVARGEILAFTDSDCVPDHEWLAQGVAAIDMGADLVQGSVAPIRAVGAGERSLWVVKEDGLYATCNVFYRRAAYERAGGFEPSAGGRLGFRPGRRARHLGFGEDTLLGWAVRRAGPTAFVPAARVHHDVVAVSWRDAVERAWVAGAFPSLVREVPELRRTLLRRGVVLGTARRWWIGAAAVTVAARRPLAALVAIGGWLAARKGRGSAGRQLRGAPRDAALDFVEVAALVAGMVRARTVVL